MSNMSYCRFHNTSRDLIDCRDTLQEFLDGSGAPLSRDELEAAAQLIRVAALITENFAQHSDIDLDCLTRAPMSEIRAVLTKQQAENIANDEGEDC